MVNRPDWARDKNLHDRVNEAVMTMMVGRLSYQVRMRNVAERLVQISEQSYPEELRARWRVLRELVHGCVTEYASGSTTLEMARLTPTKRRLLAQIVFQLHATMVEDRGWLLQRGVDLT